MITSGTQVGAYRSREYLKDMGTPERLAKVEADLASGVVTGRRAERPMPAILLDRDGTINVERGRLSRPDDIEFIGGVADAIKRAHAKGHLVAVVTNQTVVARGDCTFEELDAIHARLDTLLAESRAYVDAIYVCPTIRIADSRVRFRISRARAGAENLRQVWSTTLPVP
jgi:HAD superfamily hydrolase (TIGR01662 family)